MSQGAIKQELIRRQTMWAELLAQDKPDQAAPATLRALGIYGGAQGIWVDKSHTVQVTEDGNGVAVGLLHTGQHYPDDFADDGVLYYYPHTHRPEARDTGEIEATKNTQRFGLPVFVIRHAIHGKRDVRLGWVIDWDDQARQFLISFGNEQPQALSVSPNDNSLIYDNRPFTPVQKREKTLRHIFVREGQHRFRFYVMKRYGAKCAVCDVDIAELLQATHIVSKERDGTDDARNGIVLCANHRLAFDSGLFGFNPDSLQVQLRPEGPSAKQLQITHENLGHLSLRPHVDALRWRYDQWQSEGGGHDYSDS